MRVFFVCAVVLLTACHKTVTPSSSNVVIDTVGFTSYTIKKGGHFATNDVSRPIETSSLRFVVQFDRSAVYQTTNADNQYDINKLYGFSDNGGTHQQYSARFGWRWSDAALHLFAYVYNEGRVTAQELGAVPLGAKLRCRIDVTATNYQFSCNEYQQTLPRKSTTINGKGYLLYPYFGGDEVAPHDVTIWIKEE